MRASLFHGIVMFIFLDELDESVMLTCNAVFLFVQNRSLRGNVTRLRIVVV